jgi:hypothetical protein
MRTILSQLHDPQTRKRISCRLGQFAMAAFLASVGSTTAWSVQVEQAPAHGLPALVVPGSGPGIAGHVIEGPTTPVCRPNIACEGPFAEATVLILDQTNRDTVGEAVTNTSGNFLVTVPPAAYIVHIQTVGFYPRCAEVQATVGQLDFSPVQICCDTGIR